MSDIIPTFLRKSKNMPSEMEIITGNELTEGMPEQVDTTSYAPEEYIPEEILDITSQFIRDIRDFIHDNELEPVKGDKPVNLARASELCTIALTGQVLQHMMIKQEELDKLNSKSWLSENLDKIIVAALCIALIVAIPCVFKYVFAN